MSTSSIWSSPSAVWFEIETKTSATTTSLAPSLRASDQRGIRSWIIIEERGVDAHVVALGDERVVERLRHAEVTLAMLARADREIGLTQVVEEERAGDEGYEGDALLVELPELVEPADRIVGLRLAVGEVDDGGVALPGILGSACELRDLSRIVSAEHDSCIGHVPDEHAEECHSGCAGRVRCR